VDDHYEKSAIALYNQYLSRYPQGRYAEEARRKIREVPSFFDDADYEKVRAAADLGFREKITVYKRYMDRHPNGKHRAAVQERLNEMGALYYSSLKKQVVTCNRNRRWDRCITLCSDFEKLFENDPNRDEVAALKMDLQAKQDFDDLLQTAKAKGDDDIAAKEVFLAYLRGGMANSANLDRIQREVARIDEKIARRKHWQRVSEKSRDADRDIFLRVRILDEYIGNNPSSPFIDDAYALRSQLEGERQVAAQHRQVEMSAREKLAQLQQASERQRTDRERKRQLEDGLVSRIRATGDRFKPNLDGTVTDTITGLTWTVLDSQLDLGRCLNYASGERYAGELQTGGYRDWRLPTAGELARIYKNPPYFPNAGGDWYWSSESYVKGYHKIANIVTTQQETVFNIKQARQDQCGAVHAVRP
jgi:hypothetical protein